MSHTQGDIIPDRAEIRDGHLAAQAAAVKCNNLLIEPINSLPTGAIEWTAIGYEDARIHKRIDSIFKGFLFLKITVENHQEIYNDIEITADKSRIPGEARGETGGGFGVGTVRKYSIGDAPATAEQRRQRRVAGRTGHIVKCGIFHMLFIMLKPSPYCHLGISRVIAAYPDRRFQQHMPFGRRW